MIRFVSSLIMLSALGLALPGFAQTTTATTGCPAEPPHALAVVFGSGFYRDDLRQAALQAVSDAAARAGLQLVAPQANVLQSIPGAASPSPAPLPAAPQAAPGPAALCVPTLVLVMSIGTMSGVTAFVTRYAEPAAVGGTLALPGGRIFTATSQQTAAWYAGYLPAPYLPGLPVIIGGIPVGTSQAGAEQAAAQRGAAAVLGTLLADLPK